MRPLKAACAGPGGSPSLGTYVSDTSASGGRWRPAENGENRKIRVQIISDHHAVHANASEIRVKYLDKEFCLFIQSSQILANSRSVSILHAKFNLQQTAKKFQEKRGTRIRCQKCKCKTSKNFSNDFYGKKILPLKGNIDIELIFEALFFQDRIHEHQPCFKNYLFWPTDIRWLQRENMSLKFPKK